MKNALNLHHFCIYFKKRPKSDLVSFRFILYTLQWPKNYQSERRSFYLNSFRVLAGSAMQPLPYVSGPKLASNVTFLEERNTRVPITTPRFLRPRFSLKQIHLKNVHLCHKANEGKIRQPRIFITCSSFKL